MVYFVKRVGGDLVKIGYSRVSVIQRLRSLSYAMPFDVEVIGVMPGNVDEEKAIHDKFCMYRIAGEWFLLSDEIARFVESHCSKDTDDVQNESGLTVKKMIDAVGEEAAFNAFLSAGYRSEYWYNAVRGNWVIQDYRYYSMADRLSGAELDLLEPIMTPLISEVRRSQARH